MKITRFAQSCLLIEMKGRRILIDPGNLQYDESLHEKEWTNIDVLLITHKHGDHCHVDAIKKIMSTEATALYASRETADFLDDIDVNIVSSGDVFNIDDIKIEVTKAVHGYMPFLKGGNKINENIGFIVDDGKTRLYQPSDTICFENDYKCNILFVPVCNHGLVMGPFDAALFAKEINPDIVIPFHYDNPKFPADLDEVKKQFTENNLNYQFLEIKESIEV